MFRVSFNTYLRFIFVPSYNKLLTTAVLKRLRHYDSELTDLNYFAQPSGHVKKVFAESVCFRWKNSTFVPLKKQIAVP